MAPPTEIPDGFFEIIPLDGKDQIEPLDIIRSLVFFSVGSPLDDGKMRDALDQLIKKHLPILGARIKSTGKVNKLAYHCPTRFPDDYILFEWTSACVDSNLDDAQLLPEKPAGSAAPFFGPCNIPELELKWTPKDWPRDRRDPNTPLLLVHNTYYRDATVVALSIPHCVSDQMGIASLVKAWLQVMQGLEPDTFIELSSKDLIGKNKPSPQELPPGNRQRIMTGLEKNTSLVCPISELIRHPKEMRRLLVLPESLIHNLRKRISHDLKAKYGEDSQSPSNGDVVIAIATKLSHYGRKSKKEIILTGAINGRGRLAFLPLGQPYLHNCIGFSYARVAASRDTPIAEIAYRHCLAVKEGIQEQSIQHDISVIEELSRRRLTLSLTEPYRHFYTTSNWSSAWHGIDFGPARKIDPGSDSQIAVNLFPRVIGHSLVRGFPTRFICKVMSKADGGYWCDFTTSSKRMRLVEKLFKLDPQLSTL
ncbi:BCL5p [Penicillium verhagenii]|uniref:BCL5p n=1 Tax=Penicillium verhagenii TaxID=1562060 RepID=UPI002545AF8A|nr:BCL5p [Penicillium verhagenii]KAJ5921455.1 BCL5p [Penicillium verhagenii]